MKLPAQHSQFTAAVDRVARRLHHWLLIGMIWLIHGYQRWLSPWLGRQCRFHPTCSCYAEQALCSHGLIKGLGLTTWRLLRCQPFAKGGFDPVPDAPADVHHPSSANESDLHATH